MSITIDSDWEECPCAHSSNWHDHDEERTCRNGLRRYWYLTKDGEVLTDAYGERTFSTEDAALAAVRTIGVTNKYDEICVCRNCGAESRWYQQSCEEAGCSGTNCFGAETHWVSRIGSPAWSENPSLCQACETHQMTHCYICDNVAVDPVTAQDGEAVACRSCYSVAHEYQRSLWETTRHSGRI